MIIGDFILGKRILKIFFKKSKNPAKAAGFTLTELLVSITIIGILSTIILVNYRTVGKELALQRAAHKLAQDIRRAEELSMSAKEYEGSGVPAGYGIYLSLSDNAHYILYADEDGDNRYNENKDGEVATISFEPGIFIQGLSQDKLSINFKPPNPTVNFDGQGGGSLTSAIITISNSTNMKTITINAIGLIEVQ